MGQIIEKTMPPFSRVNHSGYFGCQINVSEKYMQTVFIIVQFASNILKFWTF